MQPPPPPSLPAVILPTATPVISAQQQALLDEDEKSKVSRWQIGNSSLGILEQVYAMEPFPGERSSPGLHHSSGEAPDGTPHP